MLASLPSLLLLSAPQLDAPAVELGPFVPDVSAVASSPALPTTVYFAAGASLLRSQDGGATLLPSGWTSSDSIEDLTVASDGRVYVAAGRGVHVSLDGGTTFAPTTFQSASTARALAVAVHPGDPLQVWVGVSRGSSGTAGAVARSLDGGATWTAVSLPGSVGDCVAIDIDPAQPSRVAVLRGTYNVHLSTNGGASWAISTYVNAGDRGQDVSFVQGGVVVSTSARIVRSTDLGATWTTPAAPALYGSLFSTPGVHDLVRDPSQPGRLVGASVVAGLVETTDSGLTWSALAGARVPAGAAAFTGGGALAVGTPFGAIWRGPGGAFAGSQSGPGAVPDVNVPEVLDLSLDPVDGERMAAIARRIDGGFLTGTALLTSEDRGGSWSLELGLPRAPVSIAHDATGVLHVGARLDGVPTGWSEALLRRSAAGWDAIGPLTLAGNQGAVLDVAIDSSALGGLYVVTETAPVGFGRELGLWRSLSGGQFWGRTDVSSSDMLGGEPELVVFGGALTGIPRVAYVQRLPSGGFPGGESVRLSEDGGLTWRFLDSASYFDGESLHIAAGGSEPERIYVAKHTVGGFPLQTRFTDDGGFTWTDIGDDLIVPTRLATSPIEEGVYYATSALGVERRSYLGGAVESLSTIAGEVIDVRVSAPDDTLLAAYGESGIWLHVIPRTTGTSYCGPAVVNSSGAPAELRMEGSSSVAADDLRLVARRLPPQVFGMPFIGDASDFVPGAVGSTGILCVGGGIGRFLGQVQSSGADGLIAFQLDLGALPSPNNTYQAMPGQVRYFQLWFRDVTPAGAPTSNFTDAVAVSFRN